MAFVVIARWLAREGEQQNVTAALDQLAPAARMEPGVLAWDVLRNPDQPRLFVLYEKYVDEAAFEAHVASDHVKHHALGDAIPRLESRSRETFTVRT